MTAQSAAVWLFLLLAVVGLLTTATYSRNPVNRRK